MSLRDLLSLSLAILLCLGAGATLTGCCGPCGSIAEEFAKQAENSSGDYDDDESADDNDDEPAEDDDDSADKDDDDSADEDDASAKTKKKKKKDKDEDEDKADDEDAPSGDGSFASITAADIRKTVEGDGWKVLGEPNTTDSNGITSVLFSVIKPPKGGAVALYDYKEKMIAKSFEKGMKDQGGAVKREGGRVLAVTIPGHPSDAKALLAKILGSR